MSKCPACNNNDAEKQQNVGQVDTAAGTKPMLFRCEACGFLYTVPPLDGDNEKSAWRRKLSAQ